MSELPAVFDRLRLPVIAAPLFIISTPDLVIAQCAGVVGSFCAQRARAGWRSHYARHLAKPNHNRTDRHNQANPDSPAAPFAVNQIVHRSNARLIGILKFVQNGTSRLDNLAWRTRGGE